MTAKQALRELVEGLSEEEAQQLLIAADDLRWERIPLTNEDIAAIEEAIADIGAGRTHSTRDVRRRLGLD